MPFCGVQFDHTHALIFDQEIDGRRMFLFKHSSVSGAQLDMVVEGDDNQGPGIR